MRNANLYTINFLEEGEYTGRIVSFSFSETNDGATNFINISIEMDDSNGIQVSKSYITDIGRNQKLRNFLKESQLLKKGNKVNFDDLIGMNVLFSVSYDDYGKMKIGDLEEFVEFTDDDDIDFEDA